MDFTVTIPLGGPGRRSEWNSTSVLVYGILSIGGAIFAFAVSATSRNADPNDFFYDFDNETSTIFAVVGMISLIIGVVFVVLSFRLKEGEARRLESQARAEEAEREKNVQDIAKAIRSNIKIRCRYCGTLNEEDASKCSSCGATL